jgi:putative ABC transport system permease protein
MSILSRVSGLVRSVLHRRELEEDLDVELSSCVELLAERHREQGLTPEQAERAARLEFEGFERVKKQVRAVHGNNLYKRPLTLYFLRLVARLKPGVAMAQAQSDLDSVAEQIRGVYAPLADENLTFNVAGMHADAVREIRPALMALYAGAAFVLLICCLNVANLLLARATDRRKEVAVRSALGASLTRILRQLLTEGILLCAIAGTTGVALAWASVPWLNPFRPVSLARAGEIGLSWPVLTFAAAISIASVLIFAITPSIQSVKADLIKTLREAGRTSMAPARRSLRAALIVTEIALGFVLLISAGLMIRTFDKIQRVRPGFEPRRLLTFE